MIATVKTGNISSHKHATSFLRLFRRLNKSAVAGKTSTSTSFCWPPFDGLVSTCFYCICFHTNLGPSSRDSPAPSRVVAAWWPFQAKMLDESSHEKLDASRCFLDTTPAPLLLHPAWLVHWWQILNRNSSATALPVFRKGANPTTLSVERGWSVCLKKTAHGFVGCHVWNSWYQILVDEIAGSYEDLTSTARHI